MMTGSRKYLFLILLLLLVFLLYALTQELFSKSLDGDQARQFVLQDLKSLNSDAEARIIEEGFWEGQWSFTVLVSTNAHSVCPIVEKRFYKLPPVSYRPETFINSCYERSKVLFREEALINSAKLLGLKDGYGCAFPVNADWFEENSYCPRLQISEAAAFAEGLPEESWIVFWDYSGQRKFLALDSDGKPIR